MIKSIRFAICLGLFAKAFQGQNIKKQFAQLPGSLDATEHLSQHFDSL